MKTENRIKTGILVLGVVLGIMISAVIVFIQDMRKERASHALLEEERFVVLHNGWDSDGCFKFTVVIDRKTGRQYLLARTTNLGTPVITEIRK